MWVCLHKLIKDNGAIVLFGREPFTSKLITSNIKEYKHKWIWNKKQSGSWANAKYMPLQIEEDIICFANGRVNYYPIMRKGKMRKKGGSKKQPENMSGIKHSYYTYSDEYYPINILEIPNCANRRENVHPTQKPISLIEYLVKTYTNEGETVLDFTMGSGTTGVACKNTNRNFIGIELDTNYFKIAEDRING
jgi:site-specific DNA-methyltransferase (adenine-specific)